MTAGSLNINNFIPTALKDEINKSFLGQFLKTPKPTRPNHDDGENGLKRRASAPDLTDANILQNNEESEQHFQADALKATAMAEKRRVRRQSGHFSPGGVARRPNRRIRNVDSGTSSGGGRSEGDDDDDSTSSFDDLLVPFPNFDDLVVIDPSKSGPTNNRSGDDAGHDNHASTSTSIPKGSMRHGGSGHSSSNSSGRRRSRHNDDNDNKDNNKRKSSSRMSCSERLSSSRRDPDFRLSSTSNHSDKHQHRRSGLRRGKSDQQLLSSRSSRHRDSRRSGGASMSSSLHSSVHSGKNHRDSYNYRRSSSSRRLSTKDKGESLDALGSGRPCSASATTCSSITGNSTTGNSFASESRTSSSHKREVVGTSSSDRRSSDKTSRRSSDKSPRRSSGGGGGVAMDKSERRSSAAMDKSDRRSSSRMDKSDRRSSSRMDKSDRRSSAAMDKSDRRMDRSDRRSSGMDKKSKSDRRLDKSERRSSATTTTKDKSERRSSARDRSPKRQSEKSERRTSASHNNNNNNNNPKSPRRSSDKSSRRSSTSHNGFRSSTGAHISTPQLDVIASPRRNSDKLPPKTPKKTTNTPKTPNKQQKRHPPQRRRGSTGSTQEDGSGHSGVLREFYGSMMSPIYNSNEAGIDQSGTSTSHSGAASDDPWGEVDDGRMQERRASKSSTRRDSRSKSTPRGSKTPKSGKTPRSSKTDRPGVVRLREGLERVAGVINNRDDDFMLPPLIQLTPDDNLSADIVSLDALDLEDGSVNGSKGKRGQRSRPPQHGSKKALSKSRHGALGGIDEESAHLPKETSPSKRRPSDIHFWDSLGNVDQEVSESKLFDSMVW